MTPIGVLAFASLTLELIIVGLLLLPFVNTFAAPFIERMLSKNKTALKFMFVALLLALGNATYNMIHAQNQKAEGDQGKLTLLAHKFREERNFYLYFFSLTLFIIIVRIGPLLSELRELRKQQKGKKAE